MSWTFMMDQVLLIVKKYIDTSNRKFKILLLLILLQVVKPEIFDLLDMDLNRSQQIAKALLRGSLKFEILDIILFTIVFLVSLVMCSSLKHEVTIELYEHYHPLDLIVHLGSGIAELFLLSLVLISKNDLTVGHFRKLIMNVDGMYVVSFFILILISVIYTFFACVELFLNIGTDDKSNM